MIVLYTNCSDGESCLVQPVVYRFPAILHQLLHQENSEHDSRCSRIANTGTHADRLGRSVRCR